MPSGAPVLQTGTVTPGHASSWTTDGVVEDAGAATSGNLTEVGITNDGAISFGINSGPTSGPYVEYGISVSHTGVITQYFESFGGAPAASLFYNINGVSYAFNPSGSGNITGPGSSVSGDLVSFNGTGGNLVADSGIPAASVVTGPASSASGDVAVFSGLTGKILQDTHLTAATLIPALPNIAALQALIATGFPNNTVYVLGYFASADGGEGVFSLGATTTANGGTIINDTSGRSWYRETGGQALSVKWFGATGNGVTDDTAAMEACIDVAEATPQEIYLPAGTFAISSELDVAAPILIVGSGMFTTTILQNNDTANGIVFNLGGKIGGGLRDLTIRGFAPGGFGARGSTGNGLTVNSCNQGFSVINITITNFDVGCEMVGCFSEFFDNVIINYFAGKGLLIPANSSVTQNDGRYFSMKIDNIGNTFSDTASIGIFIGESGGHFFTNCDIISTGYGIVMQPVSSQTVFGVQCVECYFDTSYSIPVWLDARNGFISAIEFDGCWAAFSTTQDGVVFQGSNFESVQWIGGRVRQNAGNGFHFLSGAQFITINGCHVSQNSRLSPGTFNGIEVEPGVSKFQIVGCMIGNFAGNGTFTQQIGIQVLSGSSDGYIITNNMLVANAGTGISDLGSGINKVVTNNINV